MKISKFNLLLISGIVIVSLSVLVYIQYTILEKDIETNKNQMAFAIPSILLDTYNELSYVDELDDLMARVQGTEEFDFTKKSTPTDPIERVIKKELDKILDFNYPDLNYTVNGFKSNEFGCLIHSHHGVEMPKAKKVMRAENQMCFCTLTYNTLDISLSFPNREATVLGESWKIILISFLLILVITGAFAFTIYTINKQKRLSDLKRDFINNLTHEFKTPIFSISLAAKSLMESKAVSSSRKLGKYTHLITNESKRLKNQVDKIMQMALIDSGNLSLDKKKLDIHELIERVVENLKMVIEENKGKISLDLRALNHFVTADETHINNIIYNLLDNAIKYSVDPPEIEIATKDDDAGLIFSIKDEGIGMKREQQKFIFDQFYRVQKGDVHDVKGFGLGLSYVKSIVEAHRGRVDLKSEVRHGSEFTVYLPFTG